MKKERQLKLSKQATGLGIETATSIAHDQRLVDHLAAVALVRSPRLLKTERREEPLVHGEI